MMHGTPFSSQPKPPQEEDRESGIGSNLDLRSFEGQNLPSQPAFRETERRPKQEGTTAALRGENFALVPPGWRRVSIFSKKTNNSSRSQTKCSLDKDMLKDTEGQWDHAVWAAEAESCCHSAAFGLIRVSTTVRIMSDGFALYTSCEMSY